MIPTRVRIVTTNLSPATAGQAWQARKDAVVPLLAGAKAAVVAVQGVSRAELLDLGEALGLKAAHGRREWKDGAVYAGILFDEAQLTLQKAADLALSDGATGPRIGSHATFGLADGKVLQVACASGHTTDGRRRLDDAVSAVRSLVLPTSGKVPGQLLAGSFFEGPDGAVYRMLTGRRTHQGVTGAFRDTFRMANRSEAAEGTWKVDGRVVRADWIMAQGEIELQEVHLLAAPEVLTHAPVIAEMLM